MTPREAARTEIRDAVIGAFQRFLGTPQAPAAESELADLGIDSIALVTILLELAEQLGLDLETARVELGEIRTVEDVVLLVGRLQGDALAVE